MPELDNKITLVDNYLFKNFNYDILTQINYKNKLAIIIEPRTHYRLKPTIVNVMHFLGSGWDLLFIGNKISINYLKLILPNLKCHIELISNKNLNPSEYSSILMNKSLLNKYNYENLFVFQTDSLLLRKFDKEILNHKYVGATDFMMLGKNTTLRIYNGGISFRKKSFMLYCLNNITPDIINTHRKQLNKDSIISNNYIEDFYYSQCLSIVLNNCITDLPINTQFGQNDRFINMDNIMTIHGYDKSTTRIISYNNLLEIFNNIM